MSPITELESLENELEENFRQLAVAYEELQVARFLPSNDERRATEIRAAQNKFENILSQSSALAKLISPFYDNM